MASSQPLPSTSLRRRRVDAFYPNAQMQFHSQHFRATVSVRVGVRACVSVCVLCVHEVRTFLRVTVCVYGGKS